MNTECQTYSTQPSSEERIRELEAQLSSARQQLSSAQQQIARLEADRAKLKAAYENLWHELALLKRRLFVAKAERVDARQLELEFAEKLEKLDQMAGTLGLGREHLDELNGGQGQEGQQKSCERKGKPRSKPKGRRDLSAIPLEEEPLELTDPLFEDLVAQGKATRIGVEESYKVVWKRGGMRRLAVRRVKYQAVDTTGKSTIETTPLPPELLRRSLATPSLLAHLLVAKYNDGLPFWRVEDILAREGFPLDRGTMCRWAEEIGCTLNASIVEAMRKDALRTAFCIASDATGIPVQPERQPGGPRQPCRRGHYFAMIADRDHIWFEYAAKETSSAVLAMFRKFSGYVQVDAKSVFDVLFRNDPTLEDPDPPARAEVGCWSHARRKYWESAATGSAVAREALARISRIFALDATWKGKPPSEIKRLRQTHLRPHLEAFFAWAAPEYAKVKEIRGPLRSALGYTVRQKEALCRFLDDGKLKLDNNRTELVLRGAVAVGRKAWLFVGSDLHAESAAGTMSLVASARLHRLDPEAYLRDIFRVLPHWPRDRYIELSPKHWAATRTRLDPAQLATELGPLTIPEPLLGLDSPPEQPATH